MTQDLFDLCLAGAHPDLGHKGWQALSPGHEARRLALGKPTVINELDIEPAMRRRRREHPPLHTLSHVPGGLPAHGGIESENEPAPPRTGRRGQFRRGLEKFVDIRFGAGLRRGDRAFIPWLTHLAPREMLFRFL